VLAQVPDERILGASGVKTAERPRKIRHPVSNRKIRVGIAGYGVCQFGAAFGFQDQLARVGLIDWMPVDHAVAIIMGIHLMFGSHRPPLLPSPSSTP
jgi:hypothetical protein